MKEHKGCYSESASSAKAFGVPYFPANGNANNRAGKMLAMKLAALNELPVAEFARVFKVGQDLLEGELRQLEETLATYAGSPDLLLEHINFLSQAFAGCGIEFLDTAVYKIEIAQGQLRDVTIMSIFLPQAMRVLTISTLPHLPSAVYTMSLQDNGCNVMELALSEEPRLLAKRIAGILCTGQSGGPPPLST